MRFVALLRGINVGTSVRVNMKELKALFEASGFGNVSTYINSGNVLFDSEREKGEIAAEINGMLAAGYGQEIRTLVLEKARVVRIAEAIPEGWTNDDSQKTDVAYLFDEFNTAGIVDALPIRKEFVRLIYVDGALIWNVSRDDYGKSQLNKVIGHKMYKGMTVRNVNTARYLATAL